MAADHPGDPAVLERRRRVELSIFTAEHAARPPGRRPAGTPSPARLVLTAIGTAVGARSGLLAGTYMAEYGRYEGDDTRPLHQRHPSVAPSIIIGLFIYGAVVVSDARISRHRRRAGAGRHRHSGRRAHHRDMLLLVPQAVARGGGGLGLPRSKIIQKVAYRGARDRYRHRRLLAWPASAGETAPLLFTALSNQFWDLDLTRMANLPVTINNFINNPARTGSGSPGPARFSSRDRARSTSLARFLGGAQKGRLHVANEPRIVRRRSTTRGRRRSVKTCRQCRFLLRPDKALKSINLPICAQRSYGLHQPVRLRQVHAAAHLNRMYDLYPASAPRGSPSRRPKHPVAEARI